MCTVCCHCWHHGMVKHTSTSHICGCMYGVWIILIYSLWSNLSDIVNQNILLQSKVGFYARIAWNYTGGTYWMIWFSRWSVPLFGSKSVKLNKSQWNFVQTVKLFVPQRLNPADIGDPMTFNVTCSWVSYLWFYCEISLQQLDGLTFSLVMTFLFPSGLIVITLVNF